LGGRKKGGFGKRIILGPKKREGIFLGVFFKKKWGALFLKRKDLGGF